MRKLIICLMILNVSGTYATNDNAATSKEYVDTELATKQPTIPAEGANVIMTFDSTATNGIGTKQIYDESANYASQQDALVTAQTANAAVQMAINGEFECVLYDPDNPTDCWWWNIKSKENLGNTLPTGYTQLEYITGDENCWFNTNIPWQNVSRFVGKAQQSRQDQLNRAVLGSSSIEANDFYGSQYMGGTTFQWYWSSGIAPTTTAVFDITYADNVYRGTVNNIPVQRNMDTGRFPGNVLIMNSSILTGSFNRRFIGNVWYIKLYGNNGELIFNGVPAMHNDVVGMYDAISGTFLTNQDSSGTCGAGPVAGNLYMPQNQ